MRFLILLLVFLSVPVHARETVKIGGTGSGLELMHQLGSLYALQHPGLEISVVPSLGSSGGIKAVQSGALDLAISARPVKPEEHGLETVALCRTPLVFVVHPLTAASGVHSADLVQLYGSLSFKWPEGGRARVVLRPEGESDTKVLRSISPAMDQAMSQARKRPGMIMAVTDQDNLKLLQNTPAGFGLAPLAMLNAEKAKLRVITYNGIEPSLSNLESGRYPLVREYYLIARSPADKQVQGLVTFASSSKAVAFLKGMQCIPIKQR